MPLITGWLLHSPCCCRSPAPPRCFYDLDIGLWFATYNAILDGITAFVLLFPCFDKRLIVPRSTQLQRGTRKAVSTPSTRDSTHTVPQRPRPRLVVSMPSVSGEALRHGLIDPDAFLGDTFLCPRCRAGLCKSSGFLIAQRSVSCGFLCLGVGLGFASRPTVNGEECEGLLYALRCRAAPCKT
jgi:hypothetical protein